VPELVGVVTHGESVVQAAKMAEEAIDLYLKSLAKHNEKAPEPIALKKLSGNFPVRVAKETHESAVIRQHEIGAKSLNEYIKVLIERDAAHRTLTPKHASFRTPAKRMAATKKRA
jgi:predicted HicB family RNase H-like nuclease